MKMIYKAPESEVCVLSVPASLLQGDDLVDNSGEIGNGDDGPGILSNENVFEDDELPGANKPSLWED